VCDYWLNHQNQVFLIRKNLIPFSFFQKKNCFEHFRVSREIDILYLSSMATSDYRARTEQQIQMHVSNLISLVTGFDETD